MVTTLKITTNAAMLLNQKTYVVLKMKNQISLMRKQSRDELVVD